MLLFFKCCCTGCQGAKRLCELPDRNNVLAFATKQVTVLTTASKGRILCVTAANIGEVTPSSLCSLPVAEPDLTQAGREARSAPADHEERRSNGGLQCNGSAVQQDVQRPMSSQTQGSCHITAAFFDDVNISEMDDPF